MADNFISPRRDHPDREARESLYTAFTLPGGQSAPLLQLVLAERGLSCCTCPVDVSSKSRYLFASLNTKHGIGELDVRTTTVSGAMILTLATD